jgi:hypothetical protein
MKKIILYLIPAILSIRGYSQIQYQNLDFVIAVDNDISEGTVVRSIFKVQHQNDSISEIGLNYFPGNLSIKKTDFDAIMSNDIKTVKLILDYVKYNKKSKVSSNYSIEVKKSWLNGLYNVLRIYNVKRGPYKGVFEPMEKGRDYTFELYSPDNTFTRLRRKK